MSASENAASESENVRAVSPRLFRRRRIALRALPIAASLPLLAVPVLPLGWWIACIAVWFVTAGIWIVRPTWLEMHATGTTRGWLGNTVVAGLVVLSCSAVSAPGDYLDRYLICFLLWIGVAFVWVVGLIWELVAVRGRLLRVRWRTWLVQPALAALMGVLVVTDAPTWATFLASKDAMNDQARAVLAGKDPTTIRQIGLYRISWAGKEGRVFTFEIDGAGVGLFGRAAGFLQPERSAALRPVNRLLHPLGRALVHLDSRRLRLSLEPEDRLGFSG